MGRAKLSSRTCPTLKRSRLVHGYTITERKRKNKAKTVKKKTTRRRRRK